MNPYFDRSQDIKISESGHLPHWHQDGKIQYVTFRLADSLPQTVVRELNEFISRFHAEHPQPWNESVTLEFHKVVNPAVEKLLHNGYGSCVLQDKSVRKILSDAIWFNHNKRYEVIAYAIMPNHVHLLIELIGENELDDVMKAMKSYSAHMINKKLNRTGRLWKKENFDRIVRSEEHLENCVSYIRHNPDFLSPNTYELYVYGGETSLWRGDVPVSPTDTKLPPN